MVRELMKYLREIDPQVGAAVEAEFDRQCRNIELIASENIVSRGVLAAAGTVLTNKYADIVPAFSWLESHLYTMRGYRAPAMGYAAG